ncbi:MAG: Gfo/Idh/MocA family oxidoreductase [Chthonomonadales bacterium]|nr:Gfo/Idh/MocA family oxidoreductase [Chthonomonadales bacterium]
MENEVSGRMKRREFLIGAGVGAAMLHGMPVRACRRQSPNETVHFAGIGVGSMGGADVDAVVAEGGKLVALCDVDFGYAAKKAEQYPDAKRFKDYRVMFDQMGKDIDAVVIGTPDHTHAVIAMEAMRRGKHVYCEKPLAHSVHEVRSLMAAAHKHRVVTQLGNQGHSSDSIRRTCEWVWAGAIGKVHTVHVACDAFRDVYCQKGNLSKLDQKYDIPETLDYDLWLGPAQFRPYTPFWVHWNWRGWMPFGTGTVGDWFCHVVDPAFWALGLTAPTTVRAEVTDYDPKVHGLTYPPGTKITFEFPADRDRGPVTLVWYDGSERIPKPEGFPEDDEVPGVGGILIGDKGMIVHGSHGAGGCRLQPAAVREQWTGAQAPAQTIPRVRGHHWDWLEAIRTGRQAGSNFDYGGKLTQTALLGAIAIRFPGETLKWDERSGRFTNNRAANAFLNPPYRKGWRL